MTNLDELDVEGYRSIALDGIGRSRAAAESVQRVAAAISTVFAVAVAVGVGENVSAGYSALFPVAFLSYALVGSSIYLSFIGGATDLDTAAPKGSVGWIVAAADAIMASRVHWLRSSVVALAIAVSLLPAPFLTTRPDPASRLRNLDATIPWPEAPENLTEEDQIVFRAEVNEIASIRAGEPSSQQLVPIWVLWLFVAAGAAAVFAVHQTKVPD